MNFKGRLRLSCARTASITSRSKAAACFEAWSCQADLDPAANVEQGEEVQTQPSTRVITAEPGAGVSAG
jgi:hypothetical protein